ncbi:MAG TPA: hypothetical protein VK463_09090 [Desulfomonilaceae bacterium]|nr:hypothetical protein [Desulfomonilaceae bacterium]
MEDYKPDGLQKKQKFPERTRTHERDALSPEDIDRSVQRTVSAREIVERHLKERTAQLQRRKWGGRGLILLGAGTLLGSCPMYAFSLIGPQTIMIGLAMVAAGAALMAWRPRLKNTNEALLIAVKHGNYLTVPRLALELDISFEKAEKIIQELVRSGIAEIDLDRKDPDQAIVYRIKGL